MAETGPSGRMEMDPASIKRMQAEVVERMSNITAETTQEEINAIAEDARKLANMGEEATYTGDTEHIPNDLMRYVEYKKEESEE